MNNINQPVYAISGMNLPMILEAVSLREWMRLDDLFESINKSKLDSMVDITEIFNSIENS